MASYPNSIHTFTTKNAGDTIQPAHVNDLQDEVNAIEAGLLNGTANMNSSNSTVAALSVLGGSTFAGPVTFSTTFTFAGAVTFSTIVTNNFQPRCRIFRSSTQTITSNNILTVMSFDSEDYNVGTLHSTSANPTRITVGSSGLWQFHATIAVSAQSLGNTIKVQFRKNGTTVVGSHIQRKVVDNVREYYVLSLNEVMSSASDYMEVVAFNDVTTPAESGNASSRVDQNQFMAVKLW